VRYTTWFKWIERRVVSLIVLVLALIIATAVLIGVFWGLNGELPPILDPERADVKTQLGDFSLSTDLLFAYNSAELRPEALQRLDAIAAYLADHPTYPIVVAGHADSTGEPDYNLALSQSRAEAVVLYLLTAGVANPLESIGYGDTEPIATNSTEEGRAANRRVTFEIAGGSHGESVDDFGEGLQGA
jgi:outer membrane protein OmpA-like peptidoglycan-associated protein